MYDASSTKERLARLMRFIGNKELIAPEIKALLGEAGLLDKGLTFFDAFCGTGAVSDALKDAFDIKINDLLEWCVTYTRGRLTAPSCTFETLGFDPFEHLNRQSGKKHGFFFRNYSPGGSNRMYFTADNAARIDYIRSSLEDWRRGGLINDDEFSYLIASLIESLSAVSNTAGVYGAFLKHWDPRALHSLRFTPVKSSPAQLGEVTVTNRRVEDIISDVECDVLYLDPPYTQNQYGTQYHLLETLVKDDSPSVSAITGSRPTAPMRSEWSKDIKKQILFDHVVANTKARYILVSYSADGFMSKSYIETVLKRYGDPESLIARPISYRRYTNTKSREDGAHQEYLFFIEKKHASAVRYTSPLNYIGSKTRMLPFLQAHFPPEVDTFIDAFGGGFNVGINTNARTVVYNDYNHLVAELIASFRDFDTYDFVKYVQRQIKKYGLEKTRADTYLAARKHYNSLGPHSRDPRLLYSIIMYGFNQQIRFNSDLEFNNPVGQRWFNERILEKLISFSRAIRDKDVLIRSGDYTDLLDEIGPKSFVYMDPPYRLTTGAYNDGKRGFNGWDFHAEQRLLRFAETLDARGVNFMVSYVLGHRGRVNSEIQRWIAANNFRIVECPDTQGVGRREVIIFNYDQIASHPPALSNQEQVPEGRELQRPLAAIRSL